MSLSVVVISFNAGRLEACLDAIVRQPEASEVIVADCSDVDPSKRLARKYPSVRFMHFLERQSVPQLRWAGARHSHGAIVAAVEARCVPAADWCAQLLRAHADHPEAVAIGGPIASEPDVSRRDFAVYLCEYGHYAPPVRVGPSHDLSGANLSYKRVALLGEADLLDAGHWETLLHARWRNQGRTILISGATVSFRSAMTLSATVRQRLAYGRGYAANRVPQRDRVRRAAFAAFCPLLPFLLTWRLASACRQKGEWRRFVGALPWVCVFNAIWAFGELTGYVFGDSGHVENF